MFSDLSHSLTTAAWTCGDLSSSRTASASIAPFLTPGRTRPPPHLFSLRKLPRAWQEQQAPLMLHLLLHLRHQNHRKKAAPLALSNLTNAACNSQFRAPFLFPCSLCPVRRCLCASPPLCVDFWQCLYFVQISIYKIKSRLYQFICPSKQQCRIAPHAAKDRHRRSQPAIRGSSLGPTEDDLPSEIAAVHQLVRPNTLTRGEHTVHLRQLRQAKTPKDQMCEAANVRRRTLETSCLVSNRGHTFFSRPAHSVA